MKMIVASVLIAAAIIFGALLMSKNNLSSSSAPVENLQNVTMVDGKQIIEIDARGGYSPRISTAKAGIPTVLRFKTNGTFDCSASVRIPSLNIGRILPQTGVTDIDIGTQNVGKLQGSCGMGMYPFQIDFQS